MYEARQRKEVTNRVISSTHRKTVQRKGELLSNRFDVNPIVIQRQIAQEDYNRARTILINAGSRTADSAHPIHHRRDGVPDRYGRDLLQEARDEFRNTDINANIFSDGMTQVHYNAIQNAANTMSITAP